MAVISQEESKFWVVQINTDNWTIATGGTIYTFPTGDATGTIGKGGNILYGNVQGVSFIVSETVGICSDKIGSSQPSYQGFKAESIHVFKLN